MNFPIHGQKVSKFGNTGFFSYQRKPSSFKNSPFADDAILDCLSDNSIAILLIIHPYLFVVDPNSAPLFAGSKLDDNVKRYVPKNVHVFNYKTWLGDVSLFT